MPYFSHRHFPTVHDARLAMHKRLADAHKTGVLIGITIKRDLNLGWFLVEYPC